MQLRRAGLLSETTTPLVGDDLPEGVTLLNLGWYQLKDIERCEHIHRLVIEGLEADFPSFMAEDAADYQGEPQVFVAREPELARLDEFLIVHGWPLEMEGGVRSDQQQMALGSVSRSEDISRKEQ